MNLLLGGGGAAGLLKTTQLHDDAQNLKMGIIAKDPQYIVPQTYFNVIHEHCKPLKLVSAQILNLVDAWSAIHNTTVTSLSPETNSLTLADGKTLNYKALVLAPGFDSHVDMIPGLREMDEGHEDNNTHIHCLDSIDRVTRNFNNGFFARGGDIVNYSPAFPYKGEGTDFYSLYYESFLRQDKMLDLVPQGSRVVYVSPNKSIMPFPYANEVCLDECHKRGVELLLGWELVSIQSDACGNKSMTLRNVDTGVEVEKSYTGATVNPTSKPHQWLVDAGVTDSTGMVDVNKYTLQHQRFENIFAFGDCIAGDTTRTMSAVISQAPVVKNNVLRFMHGKEPNGLWDGFSQQILNVGVRQTTIFSHRHDFEPTTMNHWVPHTGLISAMYKEIEKYNQHGSGGTYLDYKKSHGEENMGYWPVHYDELEHSELLQAKQISPDEVRFGGGKLAETTTA